MLRAGIFGATGYTGYELLKLLYRHPAVEIVFATSQRWAGQSLRNVFPAAPDLALIAPAEADLAATELVFLCLPHAAAAETAVLALQAGNRVIDLSADFRFKAAATYEQWYKVPHPAPELLEEAVYGLTEFARAELPETRLVGNPGCYTTTSLLALAPLLFSKADIGGPVIIDAKSGVTGAGREPKTHTLFAELADNFYPYAIGRAHRHLPEMEEVISRWHPAPPALIFSPHLLPVPRGILSTIYVPGIEPWVETAVRQLYSQTYSNETFVEVLPPGELASLAHVTHTNCCAISITSAGQTLIITSVTDNLLKGAAGQAVQNMNVMFGIPEEAGLL